MARAVGCISLFLRIIPLCTHAVTDIPNRCKEELDHFLEAFENIYIPEGQKNTDDNPPPIQSERRLAR